MHVTYELRPGLRRPRRKVREPIGVNRLSHLTTDEWKFFAKAMAVFVAILSVANWVGCALA